MAISLFLVFLAREPEQNGACFFKLRRSRNGYAAGAQNLKRMGAEVI